MSTAAPRSHRIAVIGGDGIGPELVAQAGRVLETVTATEDFVVEVVALPHSGRHFRATGQLLTIELMSTLRGCAALLFGAAGDPALPPGTVERELILGLARELNLCVGVREAYLHHDRLTPLKGRLRGDIDIAIVRDTTEGEAVLPGGSLHPGQPNETAVSVMVHTRQGVERAIRFAYAAARNRRCKVSLVAQGNTVAAQRLWMDVFDELSGEFSDVESEKLYPDHAAMRLVTEPGSFDVIATNMLFGGVLTDLAAGLVGGIGLIGSSRMNPVTGFGMYEPAHGSAPKYTGLGVVSPLGTIRALAMLLDGIGEVRAAQRVSAAIDRVLVSGEVAGVTAQSGPGTVAATDAVIAALGGDAAIPVPDWVIAAQA